MCAETPTRSYAPFAPPLPDPSIYTYSSGSFFPIDGQLFGNQGRSHYYHFTYEIHSKFTYQGSVVFNFTGNDDLWVFTDDQPTIDLGCVHGAQTGAINVDTLGLTTGNTYDFNLFFAERHTVASTFRIDTSIALQQPTVIPEPSSIIVWGLLGIMFGWRPWRRVGSPWRKETGRSFFYPFVATITQASPYLACNWKELTLLNQFKSALGV